MSTKYGSVSLPLDVLKNLDERLEGTHMSRAAYIVVVLNNVLSGALKSPIPLAPAKAAPKKKKITAKELRENKEDIPNMQAAIAHLVKTEPHMFAKDDFELNDEYIYEHKETGIPIYVFHIPYSHFNRVRPQFRQAYYDWHKKFGINPVHLTAVREHIVHAYGDRFEAVTEKWACWAECEKQFNEALWDDVRDEYYEKFGIDKNPKGD